VLHRIRVISAVLLVTFCSVIAVITFWPGPPDPSGQDALKNFLAQAHANGLPRWFSFGKVEFAANVLMFVPIGLFGALALPSRRWVIVPAAIAASATIEIAQALSLPDRVGTPRDVISNGLGAIIGYLAACWIVRAAQHRAWLRTIPKARPAGSVVAGRSLPEVAAPAGSHPFAPGGAQTYDQATRVKA
jgi:glycopeptide antibiotics resistance protein